jgi:hypothetical protein
MRAICRCLLLSGLVACAPVADPTSTRETCGVPQGTWVDQSSCGEFLPCISADCAAALGRDVNLDLFEFGLTEARPVLELNSDYGRVIAGLAGVP